MLNTKNIQGVFMSNFYNVLHSSIESIYDINNAIPDARDKTFSLYKFCLDQKALDFISTFFKLDISKINQIKTLSSIETLITEDFFLYDKPVCGSPFTLSICIQASKIIVILGTMLSFTVDNGMPIENISFTVSDIQDIKLTYHELNSDYGYEKIYQHQLNIIKKLLPVDITYTKFSSMLFQTAYFCTYIEINTIYHASKSNIEYFSDKEFKTRFNNHYVIEENIESSKIKLYLDNSFNDIISSIVKNDKISQLKQLLSVIVFDSQLDNQSFNFKEFKLTISKNNRYRTTADYYELYSLYIQNPHTHELSCYMNLDTSSETFSIDLISDSYIKDGVHIKKLHGFDDIYNHVKNRIANKLSKQLGLSPSELSCDSILLYSMATV